uniref:Serine/threonine-protein phosphatase 7 long form homolog n=1 Tax=Nelumbo nucifera TaxID=4432 RepID=A0A822ZKR0_NELNU|nr:TPA_asm: hypothetical protein HUJ06_002179 [Nelumbo nucifera]
MSLLSSLVKLWNSTSYCFIVGERTMQFNEANVSLITGLDLSDSTVALPEGLLGSGLLQKSFGFDENHSTSTELDLVWRRLINIALLDGEEHIEEVVKLIILFLFGYVLFPQGNSMVRSFWARYVDDLQRISDYAWGKRVHEFLVGGLDQFVSRCGAGSSGGSSSYSGCLFGCSAVLMAWLYKHTTLFSPLVPDASPCLFKWGSMGISGS